jgi:hypothetical protein
MKYKAPRTEMAVVPAGTGHPHVDSLLLQLQGNSEKAEAELRLTVWASQLMNADQRRLDNDYLRRLRTLIKAVLLIGRESMSVDTDTALRCPDDLMEGVVNAAIQTAMLGVDRYATRDAYHSMRNAKVKGSEKLEAIMNRHNPYFRLVPQPVSELARVEEVGG